MVPADIATAAQDAPAALEAAPVQVRGKFFFVGEQKFFVRGVTYGPFGPGPHGAQFPERETVKRDFAMMRELGANTLRIFTVPPLWLLDEAAAAGLRVLVGIPWAQHVTFLDDSAVQREIMRTVVERGPRPRAAPRDPGLSHRQRDPARHGALARRRARARLPEAALRHGEGGRSRPARLLCQFPLDRISYGRFHGFPLLQRLSPPGGSVPALSLAAPQSRGRPAARPHRVRHRFDARGRGRAGSHPVVADPHGVRDGRGRDLRLRLDRRVVHRRPRGRGLGLRRRRSRAPPEAARLPRCRSATRGRSRRACRARRASRSWCAPTTPSARWSRASPRSSI